jgi:hypothetical protein
MNVVGDAGAAFFAEATLQVYLQTHRPLGVALFAEQMWVVAAYLIRRPARAVSRRWGDLLLAVGGTFGGVVSSRRGPSSVGNYHWPGPPAGRPGDLGGFVPDSRPVIRLVAADRGLVQRGPSAVVRHPIYASYLLLQLGYVLQSMSLRNALVMVFQDAWQCV